MRIEWFRIVLLFFVYGFLGWCLEVAFAACKSGKFVNRGFLNGPICPIYGLGVISVVVLLRPVNDTLVLLYLGAVLLTSILEFATGWLLERIFHAKWWDYSKMPLNIGGYVCLLFSAIWGLACVGIVRFVHPLFSTVVEGLPSWLVVTADVLLLMLLFADLAATVTFVHKLSQRVRILNELAGEIREISDGLGGEIASKTLEARRRLGDHLEQEKSRRDDLREARDRRLSELREQMEALLSERGFGHKRILKAFPNLKSKRHAEGLSRLKAFLLEHKHS